MVPRRLGRGVEVVLVLVAVALLVGQLVGQPVLLGFVRTGSMSPTLEPNDGYVAVPSAVTSIEQGDVIVYRAEEIQGGGLTTHRVVGQTDRGYVTKGDANAITDQSSGEPPVREHQIVAEAVQVDGHVVAIPGVGDAIGIVRNAVIGFQQTLARLLGTGLLLGTSGLLYLLTIVSFGYVAFDHFRNRRGRARSRDRERSRGIDPRFVVGACSLLLVLGLLLPMVLPAGTTEIDIVSASFESERPTVIEAGESATQTRTISNPGLVPTVVYIDAGEGVTASDRIVSLPPRSRAEVTVTVQAPAETGAYRRLITTHRYVALLPRGTLTELHRTHPWLPVVTVIGVVVVPFYGIGSRLVGQGRLRSRDRGASRPRGSGWRNLIK